MDYGMLRNAQVNSEQEVVFGGSAYLIKQNVKTNSVNVYKKVNPRWEGMKRTVGYELVKTFETDSVETAKKMFLAKWVFRRISGCF